jgi:DNA-binding response OmpR family regulator
MYRILLVEDDTSLGYILKEYLEMHHFHIELRKTVKPLYRLSIVCRLTCASWMMLPKKMVLQSRRKSGN